MDLTDGPVYQRHKWVLWRMPLMRNVVLLGVAKRIYDEARKPENQRMIQEAVASAKAKRAARRP